MSTTIFNTNNANTLVDSLISLARQVDPEYSEACLDSGNTNPAPVSDAERFVRLLHHTALVVNGSGLCDRDVARFVEYVSVDLF
jgi:hypothetical protein